VPTYAEPGFGQFLRTDPDLLAAYRERTGRALAGMPRLVEIWRAAADCADRDRFSPAEAEQWLAVRPGADDRDAEELRTLASIWMPSDT
jgi:hypothetical protein